MFYKVFTDSADDSFLDFKKSDCSTSHSMYVFPIYSL